MRVGVLGANGMLGWMVSEVLKPSFNVIPMGRKEVNISSTDTLPAEACRRISECDFVVNCIGAIKPAFSNHERLAENIAVNAVFPHVLADFCQKNRVGIIHITTDCVFDGKDGFYTESSQHNATDDYGRSKSLGEPKNCMVLRTSIIGPENGTKKSLVEWLLANNHKGVRGFTNHMWNGLTTMELANIIAIIIRRGLYSKGTYHLFSTDVTKAELLHKMIKHWELDIQVDEQPAPDYCNRTLRTNKELCSIVQPRSLDDMLQDIKPYVKV